MRFNWKRGLGWFILIPFFLFSVYPYATAEEGEAEGTAETAAGETAAVGGEESAKGFYQNYVKPADYAISRAFMKYSPLEGAWFTNFRLFGDQLDALTEAVPGLEIMGMLRNRTWVNTHGRSGYTSGGGDLHGGSFDRLTAAQKDAALANKGRRNNRFNMIEWLGELEMGYSINPNLSLRTTLNFKYDSAWDWQKTARTTFDRPFPDEVRRLGLATARANARLRHRWLKEVEKQEGYYRDTKEILRELYLDAIFPSQESGTLSFRLGKQQIGLGKQDFNVIDILTARRERTGPSSIAADLEWARQPTWMANVSYTFPDSIMPGLSMRFVWLPDFEPPWLERLAGSPNWGNGRAPLREDITKGLRPLDDPTDWSLGGSEWAVSVDMTGPLHGTQWIPVLGEGWQTGIWYVSDFEGGTVDGRKGATLRAGGNPNTLADWVERASLRERKYIRKEHFMWGTDKNFYWAQRYWLFKWEQRFTFGIPLTDRRESDSPAILGIVNPNLTPAQRTAMAIRNRQSEDGFKKANLMATGVTLSTKFLTDLAFSVLYIDQRWFNRPLKSNIRKLNANTLLWILTYPLEGTEDRLSPSLASFVNLVGPASWRHRLSVNYSLGENTKLYFDYNWFSGDSDSGYGIWDDWDQFRLGVQHRF